MIPQGNIHLRKLQSQPILFHKPGKQLHRRVRQIDESMIRKSNLTADTPLIEQPARCGGERFLCLRQAYANAPTLIDFRPSLKLWEGGVARFRDY